VSASAERRASSREATETPALARLAADGVVERQEAAWKTSRRFQRAMARAAAALYEAGDPGDDLRVPIAVALLDVCGNQVHDEILAELVETMLPIELVSLGLVQRSPLPNPKENSR
jgi:hypothetical protein